MKKCRDCGETKALACFTKQVGVRDGRAPICKPCANVLRRTPEHRAKKRADYRKPRRWKTMVLYGAKDRAARLNVPFTITHDDIHIPDTCPVLGIPITIGAGAMTPNTATLDRKIPSLGYVPGNVVVVSWLANRIKGTQTDPTIFEKIAAYMRK